MTPRELAAAMRPAAGPPLDAAALRALLALDPDRARDPSVSPLEPP